MAVTSITLVSPVDNFDSYDLRPKTVVSWVGGTGPFDILYEWDDNTAFTSPITDTNLGVTGLTDTGTPPSDMGPAATDWYCRATITDTDDFVDEVQTVYFGHDPATATVTASHEYGPNPIALATDGDIGTWWNSGINQNAAVIQIDIDCGTTITLDRIRVHQAGGGACPSLVLYWSDDGSAYTSIGTYNSLTAAWNDLTFSAISHRYWRIEDNGTAASWMTISEIELRSTPTAGTFRLDHSANVTEDLEWDAPLETSVKEIQSIYNGAASGTFTLSFDGQGPTGTINFNDSAANVETALESLSNITAVTVTGAGTSGDPWIVTFEDVVSNVPMITADDTGLTGGTSTIAEDTQGNLSVKDALEDLASITTVNVTGTVSEEYIIEFIDPGSQDVSAITVDDDSLTPSDIDINVDETLKGTSGGTDQAPATYITLHFLDVNVNPRFLYVDQNVGVNYGTTGVGDGNPDDFFRYLYANANVGVGFGTDPYDDLDLGDGHPDDFDRFLYAYHNVDASVPTPWIRIIEPTILSQGDALVIKGQGFDNVARDWSSEARLYDTPELDGSYTLLTEISFDPDVGGEHVMTVTVPGGAASGWVVVVNDDGL